MFTFKLTPTQKKLLQADFEKLQEHAHSVGSFGPAGAIVGIVQCWEAGEVVGKFISIDVAKAIQILLDTVREEEE